MANERKEVEKKQRRIFQKLVNFVIVLIILAHPTQITVGQAVKWLGFFREEEPARAEAAETAEGQRAEEAQQGAAENQEPPQQAEGEPADAGAQKQKPSGLEQKITKILSINFTLADLLIWLLLPLWLLKALIYREIGSIKPMPLPVFVLLGLCAISAVIAQLHEKETVIATVTMQGKTYKGELVEETEKEIVVLSEDGEKMTINKDGQDYTMSKDSRPERLWDVDRGSAVKETIQYAEFFAIAYLLLINNVTSIGLLRKITYTLLLVASFVIALGLVEYFHKTEIVEVTVEGKGQQELKGKIIEESEDTLVLRTEDGEKKIPKNIITKREGTPFGIELPKFKLSGMRGPLLSFPVVRYPADIDSTFGFRSFMKAGAHEQAGTKSNRNVLSGYLCILIPLMWGIVLYHKGFLTRLWMLLGVIGGLLITLNGGAFLAILLAILVMSFVRSGKLFGVVVVVMLVVAILLSPSVASFREAASKEKMLRLPLLGEIRAPDLVARCAGWELPRDNAAILFDSLMLAKVRDDYGALPEPFKGKDDVYDTWPWQQRFMEWQPAMIMTKANPVFGVGIGNYQRNINAYYSGADNFYIEKPSVNLMEPDALNYYLVLGAELGIPGILAFLWILLYFSRSAFDSFSRSDRGLQNALAFGVLGSLLAFSITSIFTPMIIRGVAVAFVFVLASATILKNLRAAHTGASASPTSHEPPMVSPSEVGEGDIPAALPDSASGGSPETGPQQEGLTDIRGASRKAADDETYKLAEPDEEKNNGGESGG